jgi:hypothetical protein
MCSALPVAEPYRENRGEGLLSILFLVSLLALEIRAYGFG